VANIIVYIDLRDGQPTSPSYFALAEARRVAGALGASVYALVVSGTLTPASVDPLVEPLGAGGADKVLVCLDPALAGPPWDRLQGGVLAFVAEKLRPRLFLFPAGSVGLELGPPLAMRTGAALFPRASLALADAAETGGARLQVRRWRAAHDGLRALTLGREGLHVVATLSAAKAQVRPGARGAELQMLSLPGPPQAPVEVLASEPDPAAPIELATAVVVLSGAGSEKAAASLRQAAPASMAVVSALEPAVASVACPELVLVLAAKPDPAGILALRMAPEGHLVCLRGRGAAPPSPLVDRLWRVEKARAVAQLKEALDRLAERAPEASE
jgi:electron transfer flavoprotein alpha subunit